jgi:hypothetical protein
MYVQSHEELISHLRDQINFLLLSADSFDRGFFSEAKRMAVAIRILLYDTTKSSSLLGQLGKKNIYFYDTAANYDPANSMSTPGLVLMKCSPSGGEYEAPLDAGPPTRYVRGKIPFDEWWNRIVIADIKHNTFSRRDLVLAVTNKDGGAHIDPKLDAAFAQLSRFNSLAWKFHSSDGTTKDFTPNPELPSIRQITHEVLKSLKDEFRELFP